MSLMMSQAFNKLSMEKQWAPSDGAASSKSCRLNRPKRL